MCVGVSVWLSWGGIRVAGFSLPHGYHPNIRTPRTHNQCGDTIEKSQAPNDGCINVRNMLSIEEVKVCHTDTTSTQPQNPKIYFGVN